MPKVRAQQQCIILYASSGEADPYKGIRAAGKSPIGPYLSGLGLGQEGFAARDAAKQLEVACAKLAKMLVVADWHLLGHVGSINGILESCDVAVRTAYGGHNPAEGRLPAVVSVSAYCSREVSHQFRASRRSIMLALVGPPCDVPDDQLDVCDDASRDELVFWLLTEHISPRWLKPTEFPTEFAVIPATLVSRVAAAYPGLGCIAYLNGAEDTESQVRRALESGAHHVMIDWRFGAVGKDDLTACYQAIADQLKKVFPGEPAKNLNVAAALGLASGNQGDGSS